MIALAENSLFESVSRIQHDLDDQIAGLALLGGKRCAPCRPFFRSAEPGVLFDGEQLVCYRCLPAWWASCSMGLGVTDRERIEAKLASWLRNYHHAEVVKDTSGKTPDASHFGLQMIAQCLAGAGSGKLLAGELGRFCNGAGTVRVVVPQ